MVKRMGSYTERNKRHVEGDIDDNQEVVETDVIHVDLDEYSNERLINDLGEDITLTYKPTKGLRTNPYADLTPEQLQPAKPKYTKEETKMTTRNSTNKNVNQQAKEAFDKPQRTMSDAEFLAPRKVNKIGSFANAAELANYTKVR